MAGQNPSRQFRDKEYFTFDLTVTDPAYVFRFNIAQLYGLIRLEVNGQIYDEINGWPPAGLTLPIGTHEVKMWTRELSNLRWFDLWQMGGGTLGDLDFSKCKEMYYLRTWYGSIGTLTLPTTTERLTNNVTGMSIYSYATQGYPTSLDLSPWINIGINQIAMWNGSTERWILPTNNPAGFRELLISDGTGTPIRAVGSGAATSNTVDLSNQTLKSYCVINLQSMTAGAATPGNYNDIIWPTVWGIGNLKDCSLFGNFCTTIDLSSVPFISQGIHVGYPRIALSAQDALTNFIKPSAIEGAKIEHFQLQNNDLLTSLDIGTLTNLKNINIHTQTLLTSITLPSTTTPCEVTYIEDNPVLGYIDFKSMSNLTDVNNAVVNVASNNWTATIVNQVLVDLDTISSAGYTGRTITIDGTNAAPTVGPPDGLTAKASLMIKGFSVTTN